MCGISGFYSKFSKFNNVIVKMNSAISHRGPDKNGVWLDKNSGIVLGHQRLSILDLSSKGNQPMQSKSGRFVLTYNGEIYNHLKIREELKKNNTNLKWKGSSDTETLLESIDFWGIEKTLSKIDGMFAFGVWDQKIRSLILARDRIGEKPIYYGWQGKENNKVFLFGSELKSLKVHPEFEGEINRDTITLQLRHNCIPAPHTIYKNIYKLLPGHYLELKQNDLAKKLLNNPKQYWSLKDIVMNSNKNKLNFNYVEIEEDLEKKIKKSVEKQMISDVPIGAFLSGGIDSSTVVALMQSKSTKPVNTFTIGFNENDFSEARYAKKIAKHLSTNHTELYVSSREAMEVIPKISTIYDEPFSDSSQIPTYLVSQLTKQHVKVAITGDGGDELFCGYNRYIKTEKFSTLFQFTPLVLRKILASIIHSISPQNLDKLSNFWSSFNQTVNFGDKMHKGANILSAKNFSDIHYILCSHWQNPTNVVKNSEEPGTLLTKFKPDLANLNNQEQMMVLDLLTYLPDDILVKVDRAAMASSLETRVPFLDHNLIEYVFKIPHSFKFKNGQGKWILKKILEKYVPNNLTDRPKRGFEIPLAAWLRGPLRDWAEDLLNEKKLEKQNYFNSKLIREKWSEHLSGKKNWQHHLWDILMFQAWVEKNN